MKVLSLRVLASLLAVSVLMIAGSCAGSDDDDDAGHDLDDASDDSADDAVDDSVGDDDAADDDADDTLADDTADDDSVFDDTTDDDIEIIPLTDEQGRTVILHGCNYMGMEFGAFIHTPEDFQRIASWGFNIVRLPIAWAFLEPEEGVWDDSYLTEVVGPTVAAAHDAGLKVIVDMHQWQWSPCCQGNGIPSWTCNSPSGGAFDWLRQATLFWTHPDYLDHFVQAWEKVADYFAGSGDVFAYDLFNEPNAGLMSLPWTSENVDFRPLFVRFIDAIRERDPDPYIFYEPSILNASGLFPFVMDPLPYDRLVYAPHVYPRLIADGTSGYWFGPEVLENHIKRVRGDAAGQGVPLIVGETGIGNSADGAEAFLRDESLLFDKWMVSFTWWTYWRDDAAFGLLFADGSEKEIFLRYLERPYPRATAGVLRSYQFDVEATVFTMQFDNKPGLDPAVEIFVPTSRHYTDGFSVASTDPEGAWSWDYDNATSLLTVTCDPSAPTHTVTLSQP